MFASRLIVAFCVSAVLALAAPAAALAQGTPADYDRARDFLCVEALAQGEGAVVVGRGALGEGGGRRGERENS